MTQTIDKPYTLDKGSSPINNSPWKHVAATINKKGFHKASGGASYEYMYPQHRFS